MSKVISKKAESKLSRTKKSKPASENLNKSSDDFVEQKVEKKNVRKIQESKNSQDLGLKSSYFSNASVLPSKSDQLPPCPFCGKVFNVGQELKRTLHLKTCGTSLGVPTEKLIEVKRLEAKHANEWKKLELPATVNTTTNAQTEKSKVSNRTKTKPPVSNDPNLEIALALSASLAQSKLEAEKKMNGGSTTSPKKTIVPDIIMPDATVWPIRYGKSTCGKGFVPKTTLQCRTDVDRMRQISEVAEKILSSYVDLPPSLFRSFHVPSSPKSNLLKQLRAKERPLWKAAEAKFLKTYLVDAIKPFMIGKANERAKETQKPKKEEKRVHIEKGDHLSALSFDFDQLFDSGQQSDLTIYCKDESAIPCHTIILMARCKPILDEIIEENDVKGSKKIITWDEISKTSAKIFIRYLYCAKLPDKLASSTELKDLSKLSMKYNIEAMKDFVKLFSDEDFTEDEDEDVGGFVERPCQPSKTGDEGLLQEADAGPSATQNLDLLLNALEGGENESDQEEWEEMCEYLTQQKVSNESKAEKKDSSSFHGDENLSQSGCSLADILSSGKRTTNDDRRPTINMSDIVSTSKRTEDDSLVGGGLNRRTIDGPSTSTAAKESMRHVSTTSVAGPSRIRDISSPSKRITAQVPSSHVSDHACPSKKHSSVANESNQSRTCSRTTLKDSKSDSSLYAFPSAEASFDLSTDPDFSLEKRNVDESHFDKTKILTPQKTSTSVQGFSSDLRHFSPKAIKRSESPDLFADDSDGDDQVFESSQINRKASSPNLVRSLIADRSFGSTSSQDRLRQVCSTQKLESNDSFCRTIAANSGLSKEPIHHKRENQKSFNSEVDLNDSFNESQDRHQQHHGTLSLGDNDDDDYFNRDEDQPEQQNVNLNFGEDVFNRDDVFQDGEINFSFGDDDVNLNQKLATPNITKARKRKSGERSPMSKRSRYSSPMQLPSLSPSPYQVPTPPSRSSITYSPPTALPAVSPQKTPAKKNLLRVFESQNPVPREEAPKIVRSFSTPSTSKNAGFDPKKTPITPKPNYEAMLTPALRKELRKYGLKVIPRRKAVPILDFIYEETHPGQSQSKLNSSGPKNEEAGEDFSFSQESIHDDLPEESIMNDQLCSQSGPGDKDKLSKVLIDYIKNDAELTHACLTYEPIWLEDFFAKFKEESGFKCTLSQVTDILDNECITFRTRARQKSRKSPKKKSPKKKSPKKKSPKKKSPKKKLGK